MSVDHVQKVDFKLNSKVIIIIITTTVNIYKQNFRFTYLFNFHYSI